MTSRKYPVTAPVRHPPVYEDAGIIYAKANLDLIKEGNLFLDSGGHFARSDVFNLQASMFPQQNVPFSQKNPSEK